MKSIANVKRGFRKTVIGLYACRQHGEAANMRQFCFGRSDTETGDGPYRC